MLYLLYSCMVVSGLTLCWFCYTKLINVEILTPQLYKQLNDIKQKTNKGKKLLGTGMFSAVYDYTANTVVKYTIDKVTVDFYKQLQHSPHSMYPTIHQVKKVGEYIYENGTKCPVYLVEMEKLYRLFQESDNTIQSLKYLGPTTARKYSAYLTNTESAIKALDLAIIEDDIKWMKPMLKYLRSIQDSTVSLDWHSGNILCRKDMGSIVISDPFCSTNQLDKITRECSL